MKGNMSQPWEHTPDCAEEIFSKAPSLRDDLFPGAILPRSLLLPGQESPGNYFWG